MLKIKPPDYKYCPFCGTPLKEKINENKKRKYCPKDNWTYYPYVFTAAGAVIKKENKVLMVKRAREPYKNTWMFPAGFVDYGELPEETVNREVREETGLKVKTAKFLELYQVTDDTRALGHFVFFYKVEAEGEIKNSDGLENQDIGWFDIDNPPRIGWKGHKLIMKKLQSGKI